MMRSVYCWFAVVYVFKEKGKHGGLPLKELHWISRGLIQIVKGNDVIEIKLAIRAQVIARLPY